MAIIDKVGACVTLAGILLFSGSAHALSPADKCEASKEKTAGKYDFCRLKAEAKAVKTGGAPDFSKCDPKFSDKWTQAESTAGGMCPSNGDEAAVQAFITEHTGALEAALDGGTLPEGVQTCNANLATCLAAPPSQPLRTGQTQCDQGAGPPLGACPGTPTGRASTSGSSRRSCSNRFSDNGRPGHGQKASATGSRAVSQTSPAFARPRSTLDNGWH